MITHLEQNHHQLNRDRDQSSQSIAHSQYRSKVALLIHRIDQLIGEQVAAINACPELEALQASWLSLHYLVHQIPKQSSIIIKIFNLSWSQLQKSLVYPSDFDQSLLFRRIYNEELDMPGGKPFNLLVGDYYVNLCNYHDVATLQSLSEIASTAFVPFITSLSPESLGLDSFSELGRSLNLEVISKAHNLRRWRALRQEENSRFLGLTLPKVLYNSHYEKIFGSRPLFQKGKKLHWGHPGYALAAVICRSFAVSHWFLDSTGISDKEENVENSGGILPQLKAPFYQIDQRPVLCKPLLEAYISEQKEIQLQAMGFMPIYGFPHTPYAGFNALPTMLNLKQDTAKHRKLGEVLEPAATLPYLLCICRFAHYLKIIGREKIGSFLTTQQYENFLEKWIINYVASNMDVSKELKTRFPLRQAKVKVIEKDLNKGTLSCEVTLCPHLRTSQAVVAVTLRTNLTREKV